MSRLQLEITPVGSDNQDEKLPTIKMRKPKSRTLGGRA